MLFKPLNTINLKNNWGIVHEHRRVALKANIIVTTDQQPSDWCPQFKREGIGAKVGAVGSQDG